VIIRGKVHRSGPVGPLPVPVGPQQHRAVRGEPGRDLGDVVVGVGPPRLADARALVVEGDQRGVGGRVDAAGPVGDDRAVGRGPDSRGPRLPGRVAAAAAHVQGGDTAAGVSHVDPSPGDGGRGRRPAHSPRASRRGTRQARRPDAPGGQTYPDLGHFHHDRYRCLQRNPHSTRMPYSIPFGGANGVSGGALVECEAGRGGGDGDGGEGGESDQRCAVVDGDAESDE